MLLDALVGSHYKLSKALNYKYFLESDMSVTIYVHMYPTKLIFQIETY